jgi:thiosulfate/3-mercaptopyruvate sulfurtransferase
MGQVGIAPGAPVVVYDRQAGMFAARAWWVLRWMGHANVALLDGGLPAWQEAGGALTVEVPAVAPLPAYPLQPPGLPMFSAEQLLSSLPEVLVIDARAPERYRGEVEPLDAVAGHIPGALNRFFKDNLQANGRFKPAEQLRTEFTPLLDGRPVVHQCGSGVTACHNLLAMEVAGLNPGAIYPGSWSEWSSDPARPMVRA